MVKYVIVVCQLLLIALLCSIVFREENAEEYSGIMSYSSHKGINRRTGKSIHSVKIRLMHKNGKCSPLRRSNSTWENLINEMITADANCGKQIRVSMANSSSWREVDAPVASGKAINYMGGNYIISVNFGSPAKSFHMVIDTGSDVSWIRCHPCSACDLQEGYLFEPSESSSFSALSCDSDECQQVKNIADNAECENSNCIFSQHYVDDSEFKARLSADSLSVGSYTVPHFAFGCIEQEINGGLGPNLIGLGRGNLSFVSQTAHIFDKTFSYCLPSFESDKFSGSLVFGMEALSPPGLKFTPLLTNPTFSLDTLTGGGTIIDSGTVTSRLVGPAYSVLRDAFRNKLTNLQNTSFGEHFDTCYKVLSPASINAPSITLHFEGMDLDLAQENILHRHSERGVCLAFRKEESSLVSTIGNVQQQNFRVVYDIPNARIGFAPELCSL
eukprot:Gb_22646 [translate_table: standard]